MNNISLRLGQQYPEIRDWGIRLITIFDTFVSPDLKTGLLVLLWAVGFVLLPQRWVVERTFAWLGRYRRHSRDYERLTASSEAMIQISMIHRMAQRIKPRPKAVRFHYRPQRRKRAS